MIFRKDWLQYWIIEWNRKGVQCSESYSFSSQQTAKTYGFRARWFKINKITLKSKEIFNAWKPSDNPRANIPFIRHQHPDRTLVTHLHTNRWFQCRNDKAFHNNFSRNSAWFFISIKGSATSWLNIGNYQFRKHLNY